MLRRVHPRLTRLFFPDRAPGLNQGQTLAEHRRECLFEVGKRQSLLLLEEVVEEILEDLRGIAERLVLTPE